MGGGVIEGRGRVESHRTGLRGAVDFKSRWHALNAGVFLPQQVKIGTVIVILIKILKKKKLKNYIRSLS